MSESNNIESPASAVSAASQEPDSAMPPPETAAGATAQEPDSGSGEPSSPSPGSVESNEVREVSTVPGEEAKKAEVGAQELKFSYEAEAKASPPSTPPKKAESQNDYRSEPRIRVRWRADVLIKGQGVCRGFVKEISLHGSDLFNDFEIAAKTIKMRIHVPPTSKNAPPRFMEVSGKVVYTSFDSRESLFHTGIKFLEFKSESDRSFLESRIAVFNPAK